MKTTPAAKILAKTIRSLDALERALDDARYVEGVTAEERDALALAIQALLKARHATADAAKPRLPDVSRTALCAAAAMEDGAEIARLLAAGKRDAGPEAVAEVRRAFRAGTL